MSANKGPTIVARFRFDGLEEIKTAFGDMQKRFEATTKKMSEAGARVGARMTASLTTVQRTFRTVGSVGTRSLTMIRSAASSLLSVLRSTVSTLVAMGRTATNVAGRVAAVGTAAVAAVNAFGIGTGRTIDELGRMARAAGVPVDRFSRLATATRLLGGDVESLSGGLKNLSDRITDAAKDSESEAGKAFEQLGLSVRDSNGQIKTTEQMLNEVADALAKVPSDTLRASAAVDIFGGAATKLLPILENGSAGLEEYAREADRLGTVVTEQQSKTARGLLVQYRKVGEALRGIAFRVSESVLPVLTENSDAVASYLARNGDRIAKWTANAMKEISGIGTDLFRAMTGDAGRIERTWIRRLVPVFRTVRAVVSDVIDMLSGKDATRAPWLNDVRATLVAAAAAAAALAWGIAHAMGIAEADLPTLAGLAESIRTAFESLRMGIEGNGDEAEMPWAANVGKILTDVGTAFGTVVKVIVDNKDAIIAAAGEIVRLIAGATEAVKALISGEAIPQGNPFERFNEWGEWLSAKYDEWSERVEKFTADFAAAWAVVSWVAEQVYGWMDTLAKAFGLDNGAQLGILLFIARVTGFYDALKEAFSLAWGFAKRLWRALGGLWAIARWVFLKMIIPAVALVAAWLAVPTAVVWGIIAAIVALGVAVYFWWDEIVELTKWLAAMMWSSVKWIWDRIMKFFANVWDWAVWAYDNVVGTWDALKDWFIGLFAEIWAYVIRFWDWMSSRPQAVWDTVTGIWGEFTGFFKGMIDSVAGWFKGLWDGVASGAQNAWGKVKGWFGFGEDAPSGGTDNAPGFASGGIVRGAGTGVSDSIRAWLSNGEGVINARAVSHYGEGLVHALNNLLLPAGMMGGGMPVAAGSGPAMSPFNLSIGGRRAGGQFAADADAVRSLRRDFRNSGGAALGPAPRWRR